MRGLQIHRDDRLEEIETLEAGIRSRFRADDGKLVTADVEWGGTDEGAVRVDCECPDASGEAACPHLWALLLELEERGIAGPETRGPLHLADPEVATEPELEPEPPPWRLQLNELGQELAQSLKRFEGQVGSESLEVYYFVNLEECFARGGLIVELFQRERRRSGDMGLVKPLPIRDDRLASLPDPGDRKLVELLVDLPESAPVRAQGRDWSRSDRSTRRALIPPALYESLLPEIATTGRLGWWKGTEKRPRLDHWLRWDDEGRWDLRVRAEAGEGTGLVVRGEVVRGEESRSLSEPLLLLSSGLVLFRDRLALLGGGAGSEFPWITLLRREGEILVPGSDREAALEALWSLPLLPALDGEGLSLPRVHATPVPRLVLRSRPERPGWLSGEIDFAYDDLRVRASDPRPVVPDPERRRLVHRERELERDRVRFLRDLERSRTVGAEEILVYEKDLPRVAQELLAAGWEVEAQGSRVRPMGAFRLAVSSGIDWLDLDGAIDFDGEEADLEALLMASRRGQALVRLGDGSTGLLPEEWVARFGSLSRLSVDAEGGARFLPSQALLLDAWLAGNENVRLDEAFVQLRTRIRDAGAPRPEEPPGRFQGTLRPYQKEGLGWLGYLRQLGLGGCLADDMGLGKTIQVLALLEKIREEGFDGAGEPSLVVAPRSLVYNWLDEARRFTPGLRTLDYTGIGREDLRELFSDSDLVVTTYGVLRRDIEQLRQIRLRYAILDEAQAIKNSDSQTAKASRLLRADHRLALTGTPVENHLGELWSIFEFLNPGMLGNLPEAFTREPGTMEGEDLTPVARALAPFILRRTKEQVLHDLPPKTEQTLLCTLKPGQRELYEELRRHYRTRLAAQIDAQGLARSKLQVLEALLRLRQAACHPGLIDPGRCDEESTKLETLLEQLMEVLDEGHKALVFSQFTSFLALVRRRLDERGISYEYLDGSTRDRGERVERFQNDPELPLFLISLKAGGLGLNLTAADYVFLLDPWWNPAVEAQAIDRAHRIGQEQPVFAYRLIAQDTVEEKILALQEDKRELAEAILGGDDARLLRQLTPEDLEILLG